MADSAAPDARPAACRMIYTKDGLFHVPRRLVARDYGHPVVVSAKQWCAAGARGHYEHFSVAAFLDEIPIHVDQLVVVTNDYVARSGSPLPCGRQVLWFVRFSIHTGSRDSRERLGEAFLWQLPWSVCADIICSVQQYEREHAIPAELSSPLLSVLMPTRYVFTPLSWPWVKPVRRISTYNDRAFAMAVRPCQSPIPRALASLPAPCTDAHGRGVRVDWQQVPQDVADLILSHALRSLVPSPRAVDLQSVLQMRLVCKDFLVAVDSAATCWIAHLVHMAADSLRDCYCQGIFETRDRLLKAGISATRFLRDARGPCVFTLMRLRSNKKPGALPPPAPRPPSPRKRARSAAR